VLGLVDDERVAQAMLLFQDPRQLGGRRCFTEELISGLGIALRGPRAYLALASLLPRKLVV